MEATKMIFAAYLFLAVYCAGSMTVLQMQHFALYPKVGKENFREYLQANNKAAVVPAILPALLLFITTIVLFFYRPTFVSSEVVIGSILLNVVNVASTVIWQGRIHGQLANTGYVESLVSQLIKTNWIRTIALFIQAIIAIGCTMTAIK